MLALATLLAMLPAHLEPLGARAPFVDGGRVVGGSTSWRLVVVDDDGAARRVCEESTGAPARTHVPVGGGAGATDAVLAVAGGLVLRSDDAGCSWGGVQVPPGAEVHDLKLDRDGDVWAAAGRAGHPSGLLVSRDGGRSFAPTAQWSGPSPLFDVAVGVAGDAVVVWATGYDIDLEGPWAVVVFGDAPAAIFGKDLSRFETVRAVGVDEDGRALAVGLLSTGRSELLALDVSGAGEAVVILGEVPLPATHIVAPGPATGPATALFTVVTPGQLWRRDGGAFVAVDGVRARCAMRAEDDGLWLCGHTTGVLAGVHFAHTRDGGSTFDVVLRDQEITERRCPADTVGGAVCARYLEDDASPAEPGADPPGDGANGAADDVDEIDEVDESVDDDVTAPSGTGTGVTTNGAERAGSAGCAAGSGAPLVIALVALCARRRRW